MERRDLQGVLVDLSLVEVVDGGSSRRRDQWLVGKAAMTIGDNDEI